jgi:uncharacterized protein (TIGR02001 family)
MKADATPDGRVARRGDVRQRRGTVAMIRRILPAIAALVLAGSAWSTAKADIKIASGHLTGNIGLTSNYIFRGISNSDDHVAVQGGLDYNHDSGFFLGTWMSSVDFDEGDSNNASVEWDLYGGYAKTWNGITFNGRFLYYLYPGVHGARARAYDFWELQGTVSGTLAGFALSANIDWANDFYGASGDGLYIQGNISYPFLQYFAVEGHIGHQSIDENDKYGAPSYADWSLGVSATYQGLKLGVYYIDTNISKNECFSGLNWCDARVMGIATYTF